MRISRFAAIGFMALMGGLVIMGGLQAQPSAAEPPPPAILTDEVTNIAGLAVGAPQRSITLTLVPELDDVWSATWPTRVDDAIYNRTSPGGSISLPGDICDFVSDWGNYPVALYRDYGYPYSPYQELLLVPSCATPVPYPGTRELRLGPDFQPQWITLTYKTRTKASRNKNLATMTASTRTSNAGGYTTATFTLVYERFPAPGEMWGDTEMEVARTDPPETSQDIGKVQWIKTAPDAYWNGYYYYTATAVLTEPLYGSDLTVTQLLMSPLTPTIYTPTYFTAVVENRGTAAAPRWFNAEVYVRPAQASPPTGRSDGWDHTGSVWTYGYNGFLKPVRVPPEPPEGTRWQIDPLEPGMSVTLHTAITFTHEYGDYRVYAQTDTYWQGDAARYAWAYGSNPEGLGISPYAEERNVREADRHIFIAGKYLMDVSPRVITRTAAPGQQAVFDNILLFNKGNLTDTYTLTYTKSHAWPVTVASPLSLPPGEDREVWARVAIPAGTPEGTRTRTLLTIKSSHAAPPQTIELYAISQKWRLYLPLVIRK